MADRSELRCQLLALAVQLPAVRTLTDPEAAARAALSAVDVWYTDFERKKLSSRGGRGQAGKPRGKRAGS